MKSRNGIVIGLVVIVLVMVGLFSLTDSSVHPKIRRRSVDFEAYPLYESDRLTYAKLTKEEQLKLVEQPWLMGEPIYYIRQADPYDYHLTSRSLLYNRHLRTGDRLTLSEVELAYVNMAHATQDLQVQFTRLVRNNPDYLKTQEYKVHQDEIRRLGPFYIAAVSITYELLSKNDEQVDDLIQDYIEQTDLALTQMFRHYQALFQGFYDFYGVHGPKQERNGH